MEQKKLKEIEDLAEKLAHRYGYELVDVEWKESKRSILRIYIDKENGITIGDCERFSRAFSNILDSKDLIDVSYVLEVSSPGIDRKLVKPREISWALGKTVKVVLKDGKTLKGVLDYYNEEEGVIGIGGNFYKLKDVATLRLHNERG